MKISDTLRALRKRHSLTQEQVAKVINVTRSAYAYYERGTSKPGYDAILRLARMYNLPAELLLGSKDLDALFDAAKTTDDDLVQKCEINETEFGMLNKDEKMLVLLYRASGDRDKIMAFVESSGNGNSSAD